MGGTSKSRACAVVADLVTLMRIQNITKDLRNAREQESHGGLCAAGRIHYWVNNQINV